ncbi:hypothetical protein EW146_g958 [Bondarzewia mesenterica]|uniref:MARVEL domain-containing protein n=1 Tax=Bondarzewia mesenterica TaxID=1095465 RepID=A0A4S4M747_9AGAM|nr:hypothetical protein EW146_g958 [Bondarzewia mesenterica]
MRKAMLLYYRYFLFALLVVGDAVICSAGVWNLSLAQAAGSRARLDPYMIYLGAFSLVVVLPIVFLDVFWKRAITGRVWFECVWVGLLSVLHLAGAAAVTATFPRVMCSSQVKRATIDSCTSTKLLEAFAWTCTICRKCLLHGTLNPAGSRSSVLLAVSVHLFVLVFSAVVHHSLDDTVWHATVRTYPWYRHAFCQQIHTPPHSPVKHHHSSLVAPQPRRPVNLPTESELGARYQIEYLGSPVSLAADHPAPPAPAAPNHPSIIQPTRRVSSSMPSLYPLQIKSAWTADSGVCIPEPSTSLTESRPAPWHSSSLPKNEDSPLGDWPRKDIMKEPPKARRAPRKPPPSSALPEALPDTSAQERPTPPQPSAYRSRPGGPRQRSRSSADMHRPPPLDLSGLSSMRT